MGEMEAIDQMIMQKRLELERASAQPAPAAAAELPVAPGRKAVRTYIPRESRRSLWSLARHEFFDWYEFLFGWVPGRTGWLVRGLAYRPFLKRAGWPLIFGERVMIQAPWNLEMDDWAGLGGICNATGGVKIGKWAGASRGCVLNTVNHVYEDPDRPLRLQGIEVAPIVLEDGAWLGNNVYVAPGVTIGEGAIVGANSMVTKDVPPYTIAGGVPARLIRRRRRPGESEPPRSDAEAASGSGAGAA